MATVMPSFATLSSGTSVIISPGYAMAGATYTVTLTFTGIHGGSASSTFSVVVVNLPPAFTVALAT